MNDIIKIIIYNLLIYGIIYYDIKYGAVILIFMIIYWITIKSSMKKKVVEGYGFFDEFVDMPSSVKNEFDLILPTSVQYNSMDDDDSTMYSFYQGGGNQGILKTDDTTKLKETNSLLDKLINIFDNKQQHCIGYFEKYSECSKECGFGTQKKKYTIVQEKGENGVDCPYEEGKIEENPCILRDCKLDEPCKYDKECRSGYCDPRNKKCNSMYRCNEDELYYCSTEDECIKLNDKNLIKQKYIWDNRTKTCGEDKKLRTEENVYKIHDYTEDIDSINPICEEKLHDIFSRGDKICGDAWADIKQFMPAPTGTCTSTGTEDHNCWTPGSDLTKWNPKQIFLPSEFAPGKPCEHINDSQIIDIWNSSTHCSGPDTNPPDSGLTTSCQRAVYDVMSNIQPNPDNKSGSQVSNVCEKFISWMTDNSYTKTGENKGTNYNSDTYNDAVTDKLLSVFTSGVGQPNSNCCFDEYGHRIQAIKEWSQCRNHHKATWDNCPYVEVDNQCYHDNRVDSTSESNYKLLPIIYNYCLKNAPGDSYYQPYCYPEAWGGNSPDCRN